MLEGLYSAAAGMAAQQLAMDATANDLANASTNGYKQRRVAFHDLVYQAAGAGAEQGISTGAGSGVAEAGRGMAQGTLKRTDEPLDLAVRGDGFFQVRRDGRELLTRDGSFHLDADRRVVTAQGDLLSPPVTIPAGVDPNSLKVDAEGTITADGRRLGRIELVTVPSPGSLQSAGDNLFEPGAASGGPRAARNASVEQGALEASNVDLASAMVQMIDVQRSFQLTSRAIQTQDQMLEVANGVKR